MSFQARSKNKEQRAHIMGRIFLIDAKCATLEENPYNLPLGTDYYVLFVEPVKIGGYSGSGGGRSGAMLPGMSGATEGSPSTKAAASAGEVSAPSSGEKAPPHCTSGSGGGDAGT